MTIASVHLPLAISVLLAFIVSVLLAAYWWKLGRDEVPPSRRRIRRVSMVLMLASLPMFVRGLSVLDAKVQAREYLLTWMMAILMIVLVMVTALIDAINNMRIHRQMRQEMIDLATRKLGAEIAARRQSPRAPSPPSSSAADAS